MVLLPVTSLIPYINNARTHSEQQIAQIAASIKEFGFLNPIITDGQHGILAGHGRLLAAIKLGLEMVPTIEASHLTEAQKKAFILADNKLAMNAGWDEKLLAIELQVLQEMAFDMDLIGFTSDELAALLCGEDPQEGLTPDDEVPELGADPVTRLGDVWTLGQHRVMCGDATFLDAVETLVAGQLVDLLVTDPPYNVAYEGKTKAALTIQNDAMGDDAFLQLLTDAFSNANCVMKPGAVFYIWHSDSEGFNFRKAAKDAGWKIRQCLIWNKDSMILGRQDYHWKHEPCLYGWKDGASHLWAADRKQTTVLNFKKPLRNGVHPTMKPVELIQYQIENNTKGMDLVLDLFGGSGTTLIACEKTRRQARLMELDPKYCDVIIQRWQDFTGKQAVHEDGTPFDVLADARGIGKVAV